MSTFKGVIDEFPDIRVDFFRPKLSLPPPLGCFLSHVHSDHLEGLESYKSPFIYCSPATKELLIRLERKIHRVNFANGITEARQPRYKLLQNLLKPVPLETPTEIELAPGNKIRITLFDANHCIGAVMFLFEGHGKAVLYTGDIRSEPWWISKISRNPFMLEYSTGIKRLDCIYLDTSNTQKMHFPTKSEGLRELIEKVSKYPKDTIFHFSAWTFGYEEVWMTLAKALATPIHVDLYKMKLYKSLAAREADPNKPHITARSAIAYEGPVLTGYQCGNTPVPGCLTRDSTVRLHSCEKGTCSVIADQNPNIVWIRPIVTRKKDGVEIAEVGIGGGGEDLSRHPELELQEGHIELLMNLLDDIPDATTAEARKVVLAGLKTASKHIYLDSLDIDAGEEPLGIAQILKALTESMKLKRSTSVSQVVTDGHIEGEFLPRIITFPYSRHSSYGELCDLVKAFQPRDVYPCTVDEERWDEVNMSIGSLFGRYCSSRNFRHETEMDEWRQHRIARSSQQTQTTTSSQASQEVLEHSPHRTREVVPDGRESDFTEFSRAQLSLRTLDGTGDTSELPVATAVSGKTANGTDNTALPVLMGRRREEENQDEYVDAKRPRLDDGSRFSPILISLDHSHIPPVSYESPDFHADCADVVGDEPEVSDDCIEPVPNPDIHPREYWVDDPVDHAQIGDNIYFDSVDGVFRCEKCHHETWGGPIGRCSTNCYRHETYAYTEVQDSYDTSRPNIEFDDIDPNISFEDGRSDYVSYNNRRARVGYCLDDESSAYDSQDEVPAHEFQEDYDREDSFIDDSMLDLETGESGDEEQNDDEDGPDFEALHQMAVAEVLRLTNQLATLSNDYEELAELAAASGILDTDEDDASEIYHDMDEGIDEGIDEDVDEDGMVLVHPIQPQPSTTDIILTQAQNQTQESEIMEDSIRARTEAFEAARNGTPWRGLSSVSGADHSIAEVELSMQ